MFNAICHSFDGIKGQLGMVITSLILVIYQLFGSELRESTHQEVWSMGIWHDMTDFFSSTRGGFFGHDTVDTQMFHEEG